jgi:hypothetical protein
MTEIERHELAGPIVEGTSMTTEKSYNVAVKRSAYDLFLNSDMPPVDIAIRLSISQRVLRGWMNKGKWEERKRLQEIEAFRSCESQYRKFLVEHRLPTIERHLRAASMIEDHIIRILQKQAEGEPLPSMELRRLSEALSSSAGVSSRAAGVTDNYMADDLRRDGGSSSDDGDRGPGGKAKRQPLVVVVNNGPRLAPKGGDEERVINVDSTWAGSASPPKEETVPDSSVEQEEDSWDAERTICRVPKEDRESTAPTTPGS